MFSSGIIPILISNGCDRLTATRNQDGTFRLEAFIKVKQNEEDVDALVELDRVLLNIEALVNPSDDHDDIFSLLFLKKNVSKNVSLSHLAKNGNYLGLIRRKRKCLQGRNSDGSSKENKGRNTHGRI